MNAKNLSNSPVEIDNRALKEKVRSPQLLKIIRILSQLVTAVFVVVLVWAIFQAGFNGNPLPNWAWVGGVVLLAVAIGLAVMVVVYKGVAEQVGPFDYRPSGRVSGELKHETKRVAVDGASTLLAKIEMTQGILELTGGASDALDADFVYDDADWKEPEVEYEVDAAGQGKLVVKQRATHRPAMRQGRSEWAIHLDQDIPTDLSVKFGAGKADLKLSSLSLTRLRVESGVGELAVDLNGPWERSIEAVIQAGIGDTHLELPRKVGVRVQSTVSFGSTDSDELTWDGEAYTNDLYGQTPVNLDISVTGGMGKLSMKQGN